MTLPKFLELSERKVAEIRRDQEEWSRIGHTRTELTDLEKILYRARAEEQIARTNLELLRKKKVRDANPHQLDFERNRLARALGEQGHYPEAIRYVRDPVLKAELRKTLKALNLRDDVKCRCPHTKSEIDGVQVTHTPRFVRRMVVSLPHGGRLMPMVECSKCGHANVREIREGQLARLLPLQRHAARSGQTVRHDTEVLKV